MLNLVSERQYGLCDRLSRRDFLSIGALGFGGISLPQLLQAEAQAGVRNSSKSVIMVLLAGGPSHQDLFDLKMDAPSGIRGEFKPRPTNVHGIDICEHLPLTAKMMDRLAIIRSIVPLNSVHHLFQPLTGRLGRQGYWPSVGSTISKLQGPSAPGVPPFVGLTPIPKNKFWGDVGEPGFLGPAHAAFRPNSADLDGMVLNVPLERLHDRRRLLENLDAFRRQVDGNRAVSALQGFQQEALSVLTSNNKIVDALDLDKEDPAVRERYGHGSLKFIGDGPCLYNEHLLMARRLVEVGVRCVTVSFGRWDTHANSVDVISNFDSLRQFLPPFDQAITALVQDIHDRGMEKDVSVVVWGEFGRTPIINTEGGRDHWGRASCALLAGGGMRMGQVIGATDRLGGEVTERPLHFQDVLATIYHNLGIDVGATTVTDTAGRPQFLVDHHPPVPELI